MINYSIYPPEVVFKDWENFNPQYKKITIDGGINLVVEKVNEEEYKVSQVISTNPQDYLKMGLQPGTVIKTGLKL